MSFDITDSSSVSVKGRKLRWILKGNLCKSSKDCDLRSLIYYNISCPYVIIHFCCENFRVSVININLLAAAFIMLHIRDYSLLKTALEVRLKLCGFSVGRVSERFPHLTNRAMI